MASRREQENSESENICVLCFKNFEIYSIGVCDHPVCYECSTRMRVLCEQNECPICRGNMPKVIFTRSNDSFGALFPKYERSNMQDRRYGIYFTSTETQREYYYLLEYRCNRCDPEKCWPFKHFTQLKDHMRKQHELFYCDLCVDNLKIFPFERRAYNRSELGLHRRKGDPDNTSHRGHPLCEFCDQRYVDNDELFRHLRKVHYFCHFCDADGRHLYYKSVDDLKKHFRDEHYLCEEGECAEMPLTAAFRSDIDIKAHIAQEHSRYMSKSATKHARTLELEFTLAPRGRGRRIPNRGDEEGAVGYDDSGGGSLYHNPLTPSDFPALGNLTVQSRPVSLVNFSSKSSGKFTGNDFPSLGGAATSSARPSSAVTISSNSNNRGKSTEISITKTVPNQPRNNDAFPALGKPSVRLSVQNNDSKVSIQINHKPQGAAPPSSRPSASNKKIATSAAPSTSKAANFPALGKASKVETPMWLPAKPKKEKEESKKAKVAPAPQLPPSDLSQFPNLANNGNKKSNSVQLGLSSEWVNLNNVNKSRSVKNNNEVKVKEQITTKTEQKPEKASEKTKKKKPKPLSNNNIVKETLKTENNDTNTNNVTPSVGSSSPSTVETLKKRSEIKMDVTTNGNTSTIKPPPGFGSANIKPPPGFDNLNNFPALGGSSNNLTFTTSSGKSYAITSNINYKQPQNFTARNQNIIRKLQMVNGENSVQNFKHYSDMFRNKQISSEKYYELCKTVLGTNFDDFFSELLVLLPDIEKQNELYKCLTGKCKKLLIVCEHCKQVILKKELSDHYKHHTLDSQYPTLGVATPTQINTAWKK